MIWIRSKTFEKTWWRRFSHCNPICCHGNQWSHLAEFQIHSSSYACPHYLHIWKGSNQKWQRKCDDIVFPIISLWDFFHTLKGSLLRSPWSNPAKFRTHPSSHACYRYLQVWKGSDQKRSRKRDDAVFPIITLWELSVAMETRVQIRSGSKPTEAFPPPQWCFR